jgi:hypothetical protein
MEIFKQEMEIFKQEMEFFLPFQVIGSFGRMIPKWFSETGNGISSREMQLFSYFQVIGTKKSLTKVSPFGPMIPK